MSLSRTNLLKFLALLIAILGSSCNGEEAHVRASNERMLELSRQIKSNPGDYKPLEELLASAMDPQEHAIVRTNAVAQLGVIAAADQQELAPRVVPALRQLMASTDLPIQTQAARAVGDYGRHAEAAVDDLVLILETGPSTGAAAEAAQSLCKIGAQSGVAIPALVGFIARGERLSRLGVCSISALGPEGERLVVDEMRGPDERRQAAALWLAVASGRRIDSAVSVVSSLLDSRDPVIRWMAVGAAANLGEAADARLLAKVTLAEKDEDRRVRDEATQTLRILTE